MEEHSGGLHQIKLLNRKSGTISGVVDVLSFDENEILLDTTEGRLIIKGKNLHVGRLQLKEGEVDMDGEVESLVYSSKGQKARNGSLLKHLFG
ncbi:MAG TPA: sporulation protein YabP [Candidatus Pelethocola excrementipullorum]|nr:sporulation protein YabP [Candidatus Pelethocola excrementipullorum]